MTTTNNYGLATLRTELQTLAKQLLQPVRYTSLSEWADSYRYIGYMQPEPGPWRTARVPYLKEILDVAGDYRTREMVIQAAAQTGKTSTLENVIAFFMAADPCPIMVVMPDHSMADSFSVTKLEPMLTETPILRKLVASKRKRDGGNRKLEKVFPGGFITMVSAKSAHSLRARSIRVLLLDEVDAYERALGEEGDPIKLAEARTVAYPNRKIIKTSTPTVAGFSRIEHEYAASDQRHYYVPCPLCGHQQVLKWGGRDATFGMKWTKDVPATAQYQCESCHQLFDDSYKRQMLIDGEWKAENTGSLVPGFQISALYSPFVTWPELVKEWLDVAHVPDRQQSFFNLKLGEAYEDKQNVIEYGELAAHVHAYNAPVPDGVGILTCGVDVQHGWIEPAVWGWGSGEEGWLVDTVQIPGDTAQPDVWIQLQEFLQGTYQTATGQTVPIAFTGIDSGDQTELVNRQVKTFLSHGIRCFPLKGFDGARDVFSWSRFKKSDRPQLAQVGVSQAKTILHARLKNVTRHGPGYLHFPASLPDGKAIHPDVLQQIINERRVMNFRTQTTVWERIGSRRNEQLDCLVYAYAAFLGAGPNILKDIDQLVANLKPQPVPLVPPVTGSETPVPQQTTPPVQSGGYVTRPKGRIFR